MKIYAVLILTAVSGLAQAAQVASQEGSTILLSSQKPEKIQITVNGKNIKFGSQIRAIVTSSCKQKPAVSVELVPQTDDTSLDFNGKFAGTLPEESAKVEHGHHTLCKPQLAVVVDGNWQTDPENGTNHFPLSRF